MGDADQALEGFFRFLMGDDATAVMNNGWGMLCGAALVSAFDSYWVGAGAGAACMVLGFVGRRIAARRAATQEGGRDG